MLYTRKGKGGTQTGGKMKIVKTIQMRCGQAYVTSVNRGDELLELGDVFLPNENSYGSRPYRYEDFGQVSDANKRVMTVCTMLGCCGSCVFCSVRRSFKRVLTRDEIVGQVDFLLSAGVAQGRAVSPMESKEFHVLYSRMGEPSLNMDNVIYSVYELVGRYPHVKIGLSTMGWRNGVYKLLEHPEIAPHIMLQFSAHATDDMNRDLLLGVRTGAAFMNLAEIAAFVKRFRRYNGRKVSLNFILLDGVRYDFNALRELFDVEDVYIRLSPLNVTENSQGAGLKGLLREADVMGKAPVSSIRLESIVANLEASGFSYAFAPAIDEEIRNQAACGQALETLKKERLETFEESALGDARSYEIRYAA